MISLLRWLLLHCLICLDSAPCWEDLLQSFAAPPHHTISRSIFDREILGNRNGVCPWRWHVSARQKKRGSGRSRGSYQPFNRVSKLQLDGLWLVTESQFVSRESGKEMCYTKIGPIRRAEVTTTECPILPSSFAIMSIWSSWVQAFWPKRYRQWLSCMPQARWFFQQLIIGLDYCHKVGAMGIGHSWAYHHLKSTNDNSRLIFLGMMQLYTSQQSRSQSLQYNQGRILKGQTIWGCPPIARMQNSHANMSLHKSYPRR